MLPVIILLACAVSLGAIGFYLYFSRRKIQYRLDGLKRVLDEVGEDVLGSLDKEAPNAKGYITGPDIPLGLWRALCEVMNRYWALKADNRKIKIAADEYAVLLRYYTDARKENGKLKGKLSRATKMISDLKKAAETKK